MPAIYRDGKLGFRLNPHIREGVYVKLLVDGFDHFFTKHGFIYPLTGIGPSLQSVLEGRATFSDKFRNEMSSNYLVVDRHGEIVQADVFLNNDKKYTVDVHGLPQGSGVKWVVADREWDRDIISAILMADLSDHETNEQFHAQGVCEGHDFMFLTIDYIVAKLHAMFPIENAATHLQKNHLTENP